MWTEITRRKHARKGLLYSSDLTDAEWVVLLTFVAQGDLSLRPATSRVEPHRRRLPIGLGEFVEGFSGPRPFTGGGLFRDGIPAVHDRDPQSRDLRAGLGERKVGIGAEAKTPARSVRGDIAELELPHPGGEHTNPQSPATADPDLVDFVSGFQTQDLTIRGKQKAGHNALSSRRRCKSNASQTSISWGASGVPNAEFFEKARNALKFYNT